MSVISPCCVGSPEIVVVGSNPPDGSDVKDLDSNIRRSRLALENCIVTFGLSVKT